MWGYKINPEFNPTCFGMEWYCPKDSKKVSIVDVGLVLTELDMIRDLVRWFGVEAVTT